MRAPQITPSEEKGLFTRADALAAGFDDNDLRSPEYRRIIQGVYAVADKPLSHLLRCSAAALRLPEHAVITGRSAALLYGVELARPHDPVEVLVEGCKRVYGVRSWDMFNAPSESLPWSRIRVATLERTAFDLLARNGLYQGVAYCDALLHAGLLSADDVVASLRGRRDHGVVRARKGAALLDGRAESVPESVLRVALVVAGLSPQPQLLIPAPSGHSFRADLGFEREKVIVEYDGAWHGDPERFERDRHRLAWLHAHGWHVIVVTRDRLYGDLAGIVDEVRTVVAQRSTNFPRTVAQL